MTILDASPPATPRLVRSLQRERVGDASWRAAALAILPVRFIQGFVYWGGGSRRFIYAPAKLDPHAPVWMANKFQTAMPGALLGLDHVIGFMLKHFWVLYPAIILFSAAELVAGLFLMFGLFTRAAALTTVGFSIVLMLIFGWQGATCIDEWTMAACNLAMGATLVLAGSGAYALDSALLARRPALAERGWFRWVGGALPLPVGARQFGNVALAAAAGTAVFNVATYDHFRGSVYSAFHKSPVSPSLHHFTLTDATVAADGSVRFDIDVDGGTADVPAHVMLVELRGANGATLSRWDTAELALLPQSSIHNIYAYNEFKPARFGLSAEDGAEARISLPAQGTSGAGADRLVVTDVDGRSFSTALRR